MRNPEEFTKGLGNRVRGGLGVLGDGINTIANILQAGDRAVQTVDGALTGRSAAPAPPPSQAMTSEREVVDRVVGLVRQGNQEAHKTSDPKSPGVVAMFSEAIRTLFLFPLQPASGISDLFPSTADMVKNGLRDLRGSMALVRVANGMGNFEDVAEVASFAEDLIGRAQQVTLMPLQPAAPVEPAVAPVAAPVKKTRAPRKTKAKEPPKEEAPAVAEDVLPKKTASKTAAPRQRKKKPSKADATFAKTVAAELGDESIKKAAEEYRKGNLPDDQWVDKLTDKAVEMGVDFNALLARAETQVQNG